MSKEDMCDFCGKINNYSNCSYCHKALFSDSAGDSDLTLQPCQEVSGIKVYEGSGMAEGTISVMVPEDSLSTGAVHAIMASNVGIDMNNECLQADARALSDLVTSMPEVDPLHINFYIELEITITWPETGNYIGEYFTLGHVKYKKGVPVRSMWDIRNSSLFGPASYQYATGHYSMLQAEAPIPDMGGVINTGTGVTIAWEPVDKENFERLQQYMKDNPDNPHNYMYT